MRRVRVLLLGCAAVGLAAAVAVVLLQREDDKDDKKGRAHVTQAPRTEPRKAPKAIEAPKSALSAEPDDDPGVSDDPEEADDEDAADREGDGDEADGEGDGDEADGEGDGETPPAFGANTRVMLRLAARRIPVTGPLRVEVSNANGFAVSGKLAAATANRIGARGRLAKRRIKLKPKPFTVDANAKKTVTLKPPRKLRLLLRRKRKLTLTASVEDPAGNKRIVKKDVSGR